MRTFNDYQSALRKKYNNDKYSATLKGDLYEPTPARIRIVCLSLLSEGLTKIDWTSMRNFFEDRQRDNLRSLIKSCDLDRLKPICNFLKEENEYMNSTDAVELLAIIVNFKQRPYYKFLKSSESVIEEALTIDSELRESTNIKTIKKTENSEERYVKLILKYKICKIDS